MRARPQWKPFIKSSFRGLYIKKGENLKYNLTESTSSSFKVDDLTPGTSYILLIYSSNQKGASHSVTLVATTHFPADQKAESSLEHSRNSDEAVKKDFEDAPDANEKGPDIILSPPGESEVFYLSGKAC
ncbi:nephrin [Caerostris extrusa]|uniref:Nephrin n=1 Tax=Caerostris extrusa TaxID=172846 RepID=A0AAV4P543_CAEEX|nr:nephrin [Caerostris extrusa]